MVFNRLFGVILFLGVAAAGQAGTLSLGDASGFNVFVLSNFSGSGTDSQGRMAVGGNFAPAYGGGFTIASALHDSAGTYDLVVGGNFTNSNYSMNSGSAYVAGNMTWTNPTIANNAWVGGNFKDGGGGSAGSISYVGDYSGPGYLNHAQAEAGSAPPPIDFVSARTSLTALSAALAGDTANGTVNRSYSTYTLTGTDSNLNVFDMTASSYSGATIDVDAPSGSTVVINVPGSSVSFKYGSINFTGVSASNVIFNFDSATSLTLNGIGFNGSILAPAANFSGVYGNLNGQLITYTAKGTMEFHNVLFTGNLGTAGSSGGSSLPAPTPEPGTWISLAAGCLLLAALLRRRPLLT